MTFTIGLVGNPNCGKTTLFNALTGTRQRVGNWPGVTVERKYGHFTEQGVEVEVVDLPGIYTLIRASEGAMDEHIACEFIQSQEATLLINIVDASNLERNLYLTSQLLQMGVPVILAVNMLDIAKQRGLQLNLAALEQALGCPVMALDWQQKQGVLALKRKIITCQQALKPPPQPMGLLGPIEAWLQQLLDKNPHTGFSRNTLIRLLEGDEVLKQALPQDKSAIFTAEKAALEQTLGEDSDILIADARYRFAHLLAKATCKSSGTSKPDLTVWIDNVVLNRFLGIPIFLGVMYCMFLFAINIAGAFQDFFDILTNTIFVQGLSYGLTQLHFPAWFTAIVAAGFGKGINTTLTFIPIIGGMFLFLSLLEDSGYMTRAAFVMDRFMQALGLPGKSFVPLIVGFGCNVPAIMSARTLENKRDRILTVIMTPFMSCGARLAIFSVFTAAFFPRGSQNVVFSLYLIGVFTAVITGLLLRKTLLQGEPAPLIMELPPYHLPRMRTVLLNTWDRLRNFVLRAGSLIVPICIVIGALNAITLQGTLNLTEGNTQSLLSFLGQWLTPLFYPLGLSDNNWPATVGLLTGVLAKEVVVGTLNTLYTQMGHLVTNTGAGFDFWAGVQAAFHSIPQNLSALKSAFVNPIMASAPLQTVDLGVFGQMFQRFDGRVGAFAYLLFVLLYLPCVSTIAAIQRELGRGWMWFSIFWNTSLAYAMAVLFYQLGTFARHPASSGYWCVGILIFYGMLILGLNVVSSGKAKAVTKRPLLGGSSC